ncbi:MAG: extracellular solute-binding protein [Fimbriimonadaceae bacterium]
MRKKIMLLSVGILALAGCGPKEESSGGGASYTPAAELKGELEVAAFKGGYGIDFYEKAAKEFQQKNPALKINVWGDPRVWEKLRPRFIGGDPPDLAFPGWDFDHFALAQEDGLMDLGPALKSKPYEGEGTWGETFDPNALKLAQLDGKQVTLPLYVMLYGWWYDPGLFAKNGWRAPKNWDELLALCAKIKAKGIAPITYQGQYPYYMIEGMLMPWAYSIGGPDAVRAAQNLEPGAWKSPAFIQAAKMIVELRDKGYLQAGATAMSHTEAQIEFLNGRAAMIPCGTWLESEMKNQIPEGVKMEFFLPPVVAGGKGDPTALVIGIEPWMVPSAAKNPDAAIEFFKYMTSLSKAKEFVETKGTLMAIKGSTDGVKLPEVLVKPAEFFKASKDAYASMFKQWYRAFETEIENALTAMLNGKLTPEQFCERVEAAAKKTREDDGIKKYKL